MADHTAIVATLKGEGLTFDEAAKYLVSETARALTKFQGGTSPSRGPQLVARADACRATARKLKAKAYGKDVVIDLEATTAEEFDAIYDPNAPMTNFNAAEELAKLLAPEGA